MPVFVRKHQISSSKVGVHLKLGCILPLPHQHRLRDASQREKWLSPPLFASAAASACCVNTLLGNSCRAASRRRNVTPFALCVDGESYVSDYGRCGPTVGDHSPRVDLVVHDVGPEDLRAVAGRGGLVVVEVKRDGVAES